MLKKKKKNRRLSELSNEAQIHLLLKAEGLTANEFQNL